MVVHGTVSMMGVPMRGVELLGVRGGAVVEVSRTDADGRYQLASAVDRVVARLDEPVLGVRGLTPAADGEASLTISRADVVRLRGRIEVPDGIALDWIDLRLTPRLPDVVPRLVVAVGTENATRDAYALRRLTAATFELRVLRGTWALWLERIVDGPIQVAPTVPDLALRAIEVDGVAAPTHFGGALVEVDRDLELVAHVSIAPEGGSP